MAQTFGKYILQRKLAEGGMAEVFLAKQSGMEGFEKPVVIKRILPHLTSDPKFVEMFINEARVAARLSHPGIVQIFDLGKVDDTYFITMEFIHGEDLRTLAKAAEQQRSRPSLAMVARIVADTLGALHYAHTRLGPDGKPLGLVHRDISPQNVLVTYEGGVKLVDFGIAKATESTQNQQTQAGLLKGKYAYMSPEQCRSKKLDARSDVFAVGILLWELATWRRLFKRDSDLATLVAVADEPIPPLRAHRPDVPPELEKICARALARPLAERYPSAQAMQSDLEALIRKYAWEADSIRLQQYMREVFRDKLRAQDEAVRAAGAGSLEDYLSNLDESIPVDWMTETHSGKTPSDMVAMPELRESDNTTETPAAAPAAPPSPYVAPTPIAPTPLYIAPVPGPRPDALEMTGSTLRHAVGQAVPARADRITSQTSAIVGPTPRFKRMAIVLATTLAVAGAVATAVMWPGSSLTETHAPAVETATVHLELDADAQIFLDGERQLPGKTADFAVAAKQVHELRVKRGAVEKKVDVPALDAGATHTVTLKLSDDEK